MNQSSPRVVGIDPTTRGFAYAVLEGTDNLVDFGTCQVARRTNKAALKAVKRILDRSDPELLALEDGRGTRRGKQAQKLIKVTARLARTRKLPIVRVSRSRIEALLDPAKTKQEIAEALAAMFPELASRLPRRRKSYMTEDERMSIFDALSFAFTAAVTEPF